MDTDEFIGLQMRCLSALNWAESQFEALLYCFQLVCDENGEIKKRNEASGILAKLNNKIGEAMTVNTNRDALLKVANAGGVNDLTHKDVEDAEKQCKVIFELCVDTPKEKQASEIKRIEKMFTET